MPSSLPYTKDILLSNQLLAWFDANGRTLPWRSKPCAPYSVVVSEFMLQQTTVASVIPYFQRFMERFPTVQSLSESPLDDVYHLWQGLGYYSRAKNLHRTAQIVARERGGVWPATASGLMELPGIGPYAAAAIASIAFDEPVAVLDGNVRRVLSRLFLVDMNEKGALNHLRDLAQSLTPAQRAGDYAGAVMDLGAMICRPKNPICEECPWKKACGAYATGAQALYPSPKIKIAQPLREAFVFVLTDRQGRIFVRQRPESGLLANLWELPHTGFERNDAQFDTAALPPGITWEETDMTIKHTFTHFKLSLHVMKGLLTTNASPWLGGRWVLPAHLKDLAFPTVMQKVLGKL